MATKVNGFIAIAAFVIASATALAAPAPISNTVEELTLDQAVKIALANNKELLQMRLALEAQELSYKDAWDRMFLPTISLEASTGSSNTLAQVPETAAKQAGKPAEQHGYPKSSLGLTLGTYTLFNFWRDRINYDIARLNYERQKETLIENERSKRFQVIGSYFRTKTEQDKLEAAKRSIDLSEAILALVKSKVANGSATDRDVSSSTVDVLNAKNQYNDTVRSVRANQWDFNVLLGKPIETSYRLKSEFRYALLQLTPERALQIFRENGPSRKDVVLALKTSEMSLELAEKSRLPLPTVSLSGVTIAYQNGYYGHEVSRTTQSPGGVPSGPNGNIDINASLSLTLPLVGPGGLFNSRSVSTARINRDQSELRYQQNYLINQTRIYSAITGIKQQEETINNLKESFESNAALLDSLIASMSSGNVSRLELRDAVVQARSSEFQYKDSILNHLTAKLSLAETLGVDNLPGDGF